MVHSVSNITWQMRPFIKKSKSTKYTTFIWTMFIQCLETDILLTSLPFHANRDSNSKAPDVIVTTTSTASWGKWNKLRAVSLFLRFSEGSARLRERRSRETRETRAAAREEKRVTLFFRASPVSRLQSHAWSFTCPARFARWTKKKERLLVV